MDLNLVRTLVDIVDAGNLSEAARRRGVTRSQVSKELKALEHQLDATLLRRTTRRLAPTAAGRALHAHGLRMLAEMDAARAAIDSLGHSVRGHVRLSIPTGLGEFFLADRLLAFQQTHPGITLRVLFSNRVVDLIGAEIDVAVRITSDPPLDQVARELCTIRWGLFASPSYLATLPALAAPAAGPDDLVAARLLCTPGAEPQFRLVLHELAHPQRQGQPAPAPAPAASARAGGAQAELRLRPHLQSEHFPFLRQAMLAGHGVALLPAYALADDLLAGRAARVLAGWQPQGLGNALYVLTLQDRHPSHAASVLTDYLRETLTALPLREQA